MYLVAVEAVVVAIAAVVIAVAAAVVAIAVVVAVPIIAVAERQPRSILTFRFNGLLWICLAVTVIL